jgi:hypothetical protein
MNNNRLLETYQKRIAVTESVYSRTHEGATMDNTRKLAIAQVIDNTAKFLNEQFNNSVGTQRADLGEWKRFCLNLTTVALPTLIAPELVIVQPMASMSGYITYVQYTAGSNKGETSRGDIFNDPFRLGKVDVNYTGAPVVEPVTLASGEESKEVTLAWTPVVGDKATFIAEDGTKSELPIVGGKVTVTASGRIAYAYDNVVIPQHDLPIVNAQIKSIPLIAKARRVAVYYSQIAAFQGKQDYGFDLGDQLAEKAVGQLSYEIDTEITDLLIANAKEDADLEFNKTLPAGVSKAEHYEGFSEIVEIGKQKIYDATKRYAPNYMLIASNVLPILTFIKGFKAASTAHINGPYLAGTLNGVKVFVTPNIKAGKFVLGVNGDDMMSSAAVYAPYMAVVPTQLLGYADGGMSQGFSTLYALEMLNADLLIAGNVVAKKQIVSTEIVGE